MTISGDDFRALVCGERRGFWPSLARGGLRLASVPYAFAVGLRNRLYDQGWKQSVRAAVPVVSVGNLTLGGTGKTPCVEHVARYYRAAGRRVTILSRGYGSRGGRNDEAMVLEENLPDVPHLQGVERAALANVAVEELESELLVLDDGFQHRQLARDLDIVLVDATDPWGQGYLFPRGLLREARGGLRRAGVVLLTRCDQVRLDVLGKLRQEVQTVAPRVPVVETEHQPSDLVNGNKGIASLERIAGRPAAAFCGLGNPRAFRQSLANLGVEVSSFRTFPDHHAYTRADVEALRRWANMIPADGVVLTTQKDLVKLRVSEIGGRELWAVRIRLHVTAGQELLERKLREVIS